jgi:hypothetical protein
MNWLGVVKSVRAWRCPQCGAFEPRAAVRYYMRAPCWREELDRRLAGLPREVGRRLMSGQLLVAEALEVRLGEPHTCDQELTKEANGA